MISFLNGSNKWLQFGAVKIGLNVESERSFWRWIAIVFALVTILNYFPVLVGKVPFPRDLGAHFPIWAAMPRSEAVQHYANLGDLFQYLYPFRALTTQSVRAGTFPIWNAHFLSGAPFLASSQSALFYPFNFFYYVLPLPVAWTLCILARMFLAGLFMALFVRSIGASRAGAVFSGIVFSSCGFITVWQGYPMGDAAIWLPVICYGVHRLHKNGSGFSLAIAGIAFAMPVLAGHPETAAHVTLIGVAMALMLWASSAHSQRARFGMPFAGSFAVAGTLALGLASIQMIPTLEWFHQLNDPLGVAWPALPLSQALGLVSRDILRATNSAGVSIPEAAGYVGMITLLAASLAPLYHDKKYVVFLGVLTLAALGIAYGVEPMRWLTGHTPIISGLKNGRMLLAANFGLAALAGLGVSVLQEESAFSGRTRVISLSFLSAGFLLGFLLVYNLELSTDLKIELMRRPSFSRALLLAGMVPIVLRLFGILTGRWFAILACGLAAFDLLTFSHAYTGFARPGEIFPPAPAFEFLSKQGDPASFRIAQIGTPYPANAQMMYGLSAADGYEVRIIPAQRIFTRDLTQDLLDSISFTSTGILGVTDRRLDMLNVKYLVFSALSPELELFEHRERFVQVFNDGHVAILENKSVLPRAFAVPASGVEFLPDVDAQLERLRDPSFDPERSVVVSSHAPSLPSGVLPHSLSQGRVELLKGGVNELAFRAQVSEPAVLVLSQTYYPGWKATVDNNEVPVFAANMTLTGLALPAGEHEVRVVLRPVSFRIGAVLTIFSTAIIAGLFARGLVSNPSFHRRLKSAAVVAGCATIAISAVALSGNLDPARYYRPEENRYRFVGDTLPFEIGDRPPWIQVLPGKNMLTGHARLEADKSAQVSGLTFLAYRKTDSEVAEVVIPAMSPVITGLFPFRRDDKYKTAVAISNPNDSLVDVTFSTRGKQSAFGIPANGQITAFLDEPPFNVLEQSGTFKFQTSAPVAMVALLTFQDPFLMARIPMGIPGNAHSAPVHIPYVINGAGWSVELVLFNPTSTSLTGHYRWYTDMGELIEDRTYWIPPESSVVLKGASPRLGSRSGRIEVAPGTGQPSPEASAILLLDDKHQSSLLSIPGVKAALDASVYVGAPEVRNTEIAIANPSAATVRVKAGSELSVPAHGTVVVAVSTAGIVNVSAESPVAVIALRKLIAPDSQRLITAYPAGLPDGRFFPHFASGGGFDSTFVLFHRDQTTSFGLLRFFGPGGSSLKLSMAAH